MYWPSRAFLQEWCQFQKCPIEADLHCMCHLKTGLQTPWRLPEVFQGNVDIFQTLQDLSTALSNGDNDGVRNSLDGLSAGIDQISESRATIGTNMRLATDMLDISVGLEEQFSIELSNTEDADMAEVLRRFTEVQAQYDINIQLTSSNRTLNLFQRM